jgi:hypothetical protein
MDTRPQYLPVVAFFLQPSAFVLYPSEPQPSARRSAFIRVLKKSAALRRALQKHLFFSELHPAKVDHPLFLHPSSSSPET